MAPEAGQAPVIVGGPRPGRDALVAFVAACIAIGIFGIIGSGVGIIASNLGAIAAIIFLFIPYFYSGRHGEDLHDYGFRSEPVRLGLGLGFGIPLLVFPLFSAGFVLFYEIVCEVEVIKALAPPGMCGLYGGWGELHMPPLGWSTLELLFIQIVVVALPEEVFFRGFIHQLLERALPPKKRIW